MATLTKLFTIRRLALRIMQLRNIQDMTAISDDYACYIAWVLIPSFVKSLLSFTPIGSAAIINANDYILFALRVLLVFGIALVLPAILILLNYLGVLSAKSIIKGWRLAVFLSAVVAALATPVSDPMSMLLLAVPLILLYLVAALIAQITDRRRKNREPDVAADA